jgi:hypothetical protein
MFNFGIVEPKGIRWCWWHNQNDFKGYHCMVLFKDNTFIHMEVIDGYWIQTGPVTSNSRWNNCDN